MSRDPNLFEVLVVGGGPAGIAAAVRAAECGVRVGIVDDNANLGGQIWRRTQETDSNSDLHSEAGLWMKRLSERIIRFCGCRVFHQPEAGVLLAENDDSLRELRYDRLILTTGARERFLPFPGWTLPNVMGAGALQAMVKSGLPIRGKRVVVAGSGPLLLAVAAYLRQHGGKIVRICEQASWASLARFSVKLLRHPKKVAQAMRLKSDLARVPFSANAWPVAAQGQDRLESVTISLAGQSDVIPCDYLACGFHLVPNLELPCLLGCEIAEGFVKVDEFQQTTIKSVFCAGEPTRIGGVESALIEGQIAGLAAVGKLEEARTLFPERKKVHHFARMLEQAFRLRPELKNMATRETIVCRCEDVPYSQLKQHSSWRSAKLQTRCGMGPCQGRVCGAATEFLFEWNPDSVRPPIFPIRLESLARSPYISNTEHNAVTGGPR